MNQRVPESGGLPLRAMVMVLLFMAVVFLLLGLRAVFSDGDSGNQSAAGTTTAIATTTTTTPAAPVKAPVFVYNISTVTGLAGNATQQLKDAGWNAEVGPGELDPPPPNVTGTTVYFTDAAGEKETAEAVAKVLGNAPVFPRPPELTDPDVPQGVIVIVTG